MPNDIMSELERTQLPIDPLADPGMEGMVPVEEESEPNVLDWEELENSFMTLLLHFDRHDEYTRDYQVRMWTRNDLFVKGIQNVYFSELAHDYRTLPEFVDNEEFDNDLDNKIVNVLKPYRESIVSALSVGIPNTRFYPEDADSADDIFAARTHSKAAELIRRKNNARFLFIKALSTDWTQGFVAAYNYAETDKKYGVNKKPRVKTEQYFQNTAYCPDCGTELAQGETLDAPAPEVGPQLPCPECGTMSDTIVDSEPLAREVPDGFDETPKTFECIKIFGGKYVQVAPWARQQCDTPYLVLNEEFHIAQMKDEYPEFAEDISASADRELYDRWARLSYQWGEEQESELCTRRRVWIRPWAFRILDDDKAEALAALYPDGVQAVFIGNILVKVVEEKLDDHWTIALDPTEDFLHSEPDINSAIPIQEMTTDQRVLTLETMRYSIAETFIDSSILDWKKYKEEEIKPGTIVPVKAPIGQSLANSFFSTKSAALSQEVAAFGRQLIEDGQFVTGAYPTIYGGSLEGGSGTAAEYSMSRAQAMQRLQMKYQKLSGFWAEVEGKAVKDFLKNLQDDTNFVMPQGKSGFVNVWINITRMTGSIGLIEPESSEQFPISWAQKRDTLYQLMQLNNEFINEALFHPENRGFCAEVIGLPELFIPGDEDRIKQLHEILELIQQAPLDPMGMISSIPIDPEVDDHDVHIAVTKAWLVGAVGQYCKVDNPIGYANVMAHLKMHLQYAAMMAQQAAEAEAEAGGDDIPAPGE